ncbi:MAG: ATP-binding protein [Anaerolineae bacterium]
MADAKDEQGKGAGTPMPEPEGEGGLPLPGPLRPLVDFVARIKASVHVKLLVGFFIGALLLLGMGILSVVAINRMNQQVGELNDLQERVDRSRQAIYLITGQSHFRAMALVCAVVQPPPTESPTDCTPKIPWNNKIATAKEEFTEHLDELDRISPPERDEFFSQVKEAEGRFAVSSERALALSEAGDIEGALDVHIAEEHEISHELETALNELIDDSSAEMTETTAAFRSDRTALTAAVGTFSGVSLVSALFLGLVLSWAFVRPVRRMGQAMRRIASGDFSQPVQVENRDELGELANRINDTATDLTKLQEATLAHERARALQERITQVTLAQEEERRRISRELHDGLGPSLAAIGNRLRACEQMVRTDPRRAEKELRETTKSLKGHVQNIRRLIYDLRPLAIDQIGLKAAVQQQLDRFSQETGVQAVFNISGDLALDSLAEVTVFRVVQECLSNVQKHANASKVEVRLRGTKTGLELRVQDDGQGFDPNDVVSGTIGKGVGLMSMRERAELVGGRLSVQSSPGTGCQVTLYVPAKEVEVGAHSNPTG